MGPMGVHAMLLHRMKSAVAGLASQYPTGRSLRFLSMGEMG